MTVLRQLRDELGQAAWTAKTFRARGRLRVQTAAVRALSLPDLPRRRRVRGSVWGISVVRDERDIIELVVRHTLAQDVDHLLIADNGSRDGTRELLVDLADRDPRIHVAIDDLKAHHQSEKMTYLAHLAWRAGADWILPLDADEFFFADGMTVGRFLRASHADVIHADMYPMVRVSAGPVSRNDEYVLDATPDPVGKVAIRSHPLAVVGNGNHWAARVGEHGRGLRIAHGQYRSAEQVTRKIRQGAAAEARAQLQVDAARADHWHQGSKLNDHELADAWENLTRGLPEPRLDFPAFGPMTRVTPLTWPTWDPESQIPGPATTNDRGHRKPSAPWKPPSSGARASEW